MEGCQSDAKSSALGSLATWARPNRKSRRNLRRKILEDAGCLDAMAKALKETYGAPAQLMRKENAYCM